jgi:probable F420-dependent oxidoreductase
VPEADGVTAVVEDLSAYVIAGAVRSEQEASEWETVSRTPAQGIEDGVAAERLGFRRVWLSERPDIKQADVILSGIAARTTRLEVATGLIGATTRHPWFTAALGATMQACYGPRFVLGLGRGDPGFYRGSGIKAASYEAMADYISILRRLWAGEAVSYDGPAGTFDALAFAEVYHGPPPPIFFGSIAQPKGARLVAEHCDGVMLGVMMTPGAVRDAVGRIRLECERIGRDPAEIRVVAPVVTAPELDDFEARALAHARLVTYLTYPGHGETLVRINGWDPSVLEAVRGHELFSGLDVVPDLAFQRHQLMDVAARVPDACIAECSAIGSIDECAATLQRFRDAGADEIATYGSTPGQNAKLVAAWRERQRAVSSADTSPVS